MHPNGGQAGEEDEARAPASSRRLCCWQQQERPSQQTPACLPAWTSLLLIVKEYSTLIKTSISYHANGKINNWFFINIQKYHGIFGSGFVVKMIWSPSMHVSVHMFICVCTWDLLQPSTSKSHFNWVSFKETTFEFQTIVMVQIFHHLSKYTYINVYTYNR